MDLLEVRHSGRFERKLYLQEEDLDKIYENLSSFEIEDI